ncbi:hypothetical protein [Saccharopolyspora sp. CA-218241]|uniref:hypothetical protein n=1 Tax=Saccharopolyspora sp. CA-218241 TaxID=3240027 RepID=UPI003D971209
MGTFSVDPDRMRESGGDLRAAGADLGAAVGRARADTAGDASVWGVDDAGADFGAAHQELADLAARALAALGRGVDELGAALRATADDTEETDREHADRLRRLSDELRSPR